LAHHHHHHHHHHVACPVLTAAMKMKTNKQTITTTTVLRPFWTLWCKGRLIEADTPTIRLGSTPSGPTSAHLHSPQSFTGRMPFLLPNQQRQSTEGN